MSSNSDVKVDYDPDSVVYRQAHFDSNHDLHRDNDLPALIVRYPNGELMKVSFWKNGCLHKENGYAKIEYHPNGQFKLKARYVNGYPVRDSNSPYAIEFDENGVPYRVEYAYNDGSYKTVMI